MLTINKSEPESLFSIIVVALVATTGIMHINLTPLIVGGFIDDLGFSSQFAGWIMATAVAGASLGAILTSIFLTKINLRLGIYICLITMMVLDGVSSVTTSGTALIILRFVSGFFGAVASSIAFGTFAALKQPGRGYGSQNFLYFTSAAVIFALLPNAMKMSGVAAVFYTIMGFTILCVVLFNRVDLAYQPANSQQHYGSRDLLTRPAVFISLFMFLLVMMATGGLWTYFERIGVAAGHSLQHVGISISAACVTGGIGAIAVILIGAWSLKFAAFLLGTVCYGMGIYMFTDPEITATGYFIAALLEGFGLSFLISIFQTLLGSLDKVGRVAAFGVFVIFIGRTLGVMLASSVVADNVYTNVAWCSLGLVLLSLIGVAVVLSGKEPSLSDESVEQPGP